MTKNKTTTKNKHTIKQTKTKKQKNKKTKNKTKQNKTKQKTPLLSSSCGLKFMIVQTLLIMTDLIVLLITIGKFIYLCT